MGLGRPLDAVRDETVDVLAGLPRYLGGPSRRSRVASTAVFAVAPLKPKVTTLQVSRTIRTSAVSPTASCMINASTVRTVVPVVQSENGSSTARAAGTSAGRPAQQQVPATGELARPMTILCVGRCSSREA